MADNVVNEEALRYLIDKDLKPSFDYRDVWKAEHNNAFTVAKMLNLDLLADVQTMVADALEQGQTFEQFKATLKPLLVKKGWWGVQEMVDPLTQETKPVQLGSNGRIKTIYKTNMRTARAAGQWERAQRTKRALPYLLYELGPSENHRHEHEKWAGTCLPIDDPWWKTHMTPNGWGCKCGVRQVSRSEYQSLLASGKIKTEAPNDGTKEWINKRTGEVEIIPRGIDPGWNYNPGLNSAEKLKTYGDKLNVADPDIAKASIQSSVSSKQFEDWYSKPEGNYPLAVLNKTAMDKIGAKVQTAVLSPETVKKQHRVHKELAAQEYAMVQQVLDAGEQIQDGQQNLVYFLEQPKGYVAIVKTTRTGQRFVCHQL